MKVLFVVSEFGFWAEECVEPLKEIREKHKVEVATPTGEVPQPDPESVEDYSEFLEEDDDLNDPLALMEAYRNREDYDALVLPGGHGTLWDINQDEQIQELLKEAVGKQGALVICHAVGILGFTEELTDGREITGFPNEWEKDQVDENEVRDGKKLPYRVEDKLKKAGADWDPELGKEVSVKIDGNLVTARGPDSSQKAAKLFLKELEK